jgi:hypothetical protein
MLIFPSYFLKLTFFLDLPYSPPYDFELPNFSELGKTLRNLAFTKPYPADPPPEVEFDVKDLPTSWDFLNLPELGEIEIYTKHKYLTIFFRE